MPESQALDLLREGVALANAGRKDQARERIRAALKLTPDSELGWLWLAGVSDSPHESLRAIETVLRINPKNPRALAGLNPTRLRAGIAAAQAGDTDSALELLRECVRQDPKNELAWFWLGCTTGDAQEAHAALAKVVEINPTNDAARARLAPLRSKLAGTRPAWQCPFCGHGAEVRQPVCPGCRTIMTLRWVEGLFDNRDRHEEKLRAGLARLLDRVGSKPEFLPHYYLGLGFLQVQNLDAAVTHFQAALRLQDHEAVRAVLAAIEKQRIIRTRSTIQVDERPKAILIIDDSLTIRKVVSFSLRESGYRVLEAASGAEALELIDREGPPDLILLDIMMPGMDGYTVCEELRRRKDTASLPVVMLSGKDRPFSRLRGQRAGSTDYLTKPFQPESLLAKIREYCPSEVLPAS
jgi:CheY-like chemotaxis protein